MKKIISTFGAFIFFCTIGYSQYTQIKGFVNLNYFADFNKDSAGSHSNNYFRLGQYDFFVTSQVTDKISMLGESVFEYSTDFGVDVERLFMKYNYDNHFAISGGKFHSPIGYWNNAFHHGLVIQPLMIRPDAIRFEDDGGILPVHETGIQFDYEHMTSSNIGINVLISNGLGSTPISDQNNDKAVTANLHMEPMENFVLTASAYYNQGPPQFMNPQGIEVYNPTTTTILNGSIAYMNGRLPIEFIGEYYSINQDEDSIGLRNKVTQVIELYAGYKIKKFTIYANYEQNIYPTGIEYYIKDNIMAIIGGIRYKPSPISVIKLQYRYHDSEIYGVHNFIEAQWAIGF